MADETILVDVDYNTSEAQRNVDALTDDIFELTEANKKLRQQQKLNKGETEKEIQTRKQLNRQIEANKDAIKRARKERNNSIRTIRGEQSAFQKLGKTLKSTATSYFGVAAAIGLITKGISALISSNAEYEQSLASLQAITGASTEDLQFYSDTAKETSKVTLQSANDIVRAYELVGSARPELLKNKEALAEVTKQAIILSEATGGKLGLEDSARSVTGVLNQFELQSNQASRAINALAAGSKEGAAAIPALSEGFKVFGTVLAAGNGTLEQGIGLQEVLAEKQIFGAEAGTKLRNILITLQADQENYVDGVFDTNLALQNLADENLTVTELTKRFGKQNVVAAQILANNVEKFNQYTEAVTGTTVALEQQAIQNDTLANNWKGLTNTIKNSFLQGGINKALNAFVKDAKRELDELVDNFKMVGLVWDRLTGKLSKTEYREALVELKTNVEAVGDSVEETAEKTAKADEEAAQRARERLAAQKAAALEREAAQKRELEGLVAIEEQKRKEDEALMMRRELAAENRELDLEIEREHREALKEIDDEFRESETEGILTVNDLENQLREQQIAADEAAAEKKRQIFAATVQTIGQLSNELASTLVSNNQATANKEIAILDAQKNYELKRAGDDAKKQERIEKEYEEKKLKVQKEAAEKNKKIQIANAIIQGALVVLNALGTTPFIPLGLLAAAAAVITTGLQISTIKNQSFGKGGKVQLAKKGMKMGTFEGASHSGGGIDLFTGSGQHVANVEGKENFYVVNKNASDYINSLSDINQRIGGGVPLSNKSNRMQSGGQADVDQVRTADDQTENVVRNLPPIVVRVEDIKTGLEQRDQVTNVGVV